MPSASDFTPICDPYIISTDTCTPETCCLEYGQMSYLPNFPANVFFTAIFILLLVPSSIFGIRFKTWSFMAWMSLGLTGEAIGYVGRIMLYYNIFDFDGFLMYLIPLTIAPAFITASIYLCLARLIHILDPALKHTRLQPMTYTKIFVTFDIISLLLQSAGGAMAAMGDTPDDVDLGVNVMIAGLAFQVFSLVVFSGLCADFAWRLHKGTKSQLSWQMQRGAKSQGSVATDADTSYDSEGSRFPDVGEPTIQYAHITRTFMFKGFVGALVAATILILIRSVYRLLELQGGFHGDLANNEVVFMILEAPMIFLSCAAMIAFHPGFALQRLWSMSDFRTSASPAAGVKPKSHWFKFGKDNRRGTYDAVSA